MSILVVRSGGLGDFVITLPHVAALARKYGALTVATHQKYFGLLSTFGIDAETWDIDRGETTRLLYELHPSEFGGVVSWIATSGAAPTIRGRLFTLAIRPPDDGNREPIASSYWRQLALPGLRPSASAIPAKWNQVGMGSGTSRLVVHAGSGGRWKCWPGERFIALAGTWLAHHAEGEVVFLVGPTETETGSIRADLTTLPHGCRLFESDDLPKTVRLLIGASVFVGNDSGVSHLSALLGVPTVAIFGPTSSSRWGPEGPRVRIVRNPVPCSPCTPVMARSCDHRSCLGRVDVTSVLNAVEAISGQCRTGFVPFPASTAPGTFGNFPSAPNHVEG